MYLVFDFPVGSLANGRPAFHEAVNLRKCHRECPPAFLRFASSWLLNCVGPLVVQALGDWVSKKHRELHITYKEAV